MSDHENINAETAHFGDVVSQLKELRGYARINAEMLSTHWLGFDTGQYKNITFAEKFDVLLHQQRVLLDELNKTIEDLEAETHRLASRA